MLHPPPSRPGPTALAWPAAGCAPHPPRTAASGSARGAPAPRRPHRPGGRRSGRHRLRSWRTAARYPFAATATHRSPAAAPATPNPAAPVWRVAACAASARCRAKKVWSSTCAYTSVGYVSMGVIGAFPASLRRHRSPSDRRGTLHINARKKPLTVGSRNAGTAGSPSSARCRRSCCGPAPVAARHTAGRTTSVPG